MISGIQCHSLRYFGHMQERRLRRNDTKIRHYRKLTTKYFSKMETTHVLSYTHINLRHGLNIERNPTDIQIDNVLIQAIIFHGRKLNRLIYILFVLSSIFQARTTFRCFLLILRPWSSLYLGWLKFRGVPIFIVFVEGPIKEFQNQRNGNFLYE